MFEKVAPRCPRCGYEIHQPIETLESFTCSACQSGFRVLFDKASGSTAFVEEVGRELPEPLHLPRGSVRALVALSLAGTCWLLIFLGRDVPSYLLSLLLTVIGYYFGFRAKVRAAESRLYDPTAREAAPLHAPGGFVRAVLILGFLAGGLALHAAGRLSELAFLEFYVILAGLIAGNVFGRVFTLARLGPVLVSVNHVKGAAVLVAAAALVAMLLSGRYQQMHAAAIVLCAGVSFYYGSRS